MKVAGIIAEYNPFHNGHKYHIDKVRRKTGADFCIVVMSGDFTQRGEPAVMDKYMRAKMALMEGADMVLELPVCFSCASAPFFAESAVSLLDDLGVVDYLAFGSECGNVSMLQEASSILVQEPPDYTKALKAGLRSGLSYPSAQAKSLIDYISHNIAFSSDSSLNMADSQELSALLSSPNNILGIEYCKSLISRGSSILPVAVLRNGGGYADKELQEENSSALAIRTTLQTEYSLEKIRSQVPENVYTVMQQQYGKTFPIFPDMISGMLLYKLLAEADTGYTCYQDVSKELSDKIRNALPAYQDFSSFCSLLKTKDLTYTRISRSLLHIFLNIRKSDMKYDVQSGLVFYGRILGFRKTCAPLLTAIKANSSIPLISKMADVGNYLEDAAMHQLKKDIQAAHLYNALVQQAYRTKLPGEMQRQIITL